MSDERAARMAANETEGSNDEGGGETDAPHLSEREEAKVDEHRNLSSVTVYSVIRAEGVEELKRPVSSLWWSGVAAGLGISTSVLAEGILHDTFAGHSYLPAIENLGYSVGFILVILARLQLFTENTLTVVLPLLKSPSPRLFGLTLRLWTVVLAANMVGTFITALITATLGTSTPEHLAAMIEVSHHYAENTPWEAFSRGIPAGFFIAAIVWMLPSSEGFEIFVIFLFTYLIAMAEFTHVIAGSTEAFLLVIVGEISPLESVALLVPTFAGNVAGGTGLFALLAYGQVASELDGETTHE